MVGAFAVLIAVVIAVSYGNAAQANVDNFRIQDYEIRYELGRDSEGRSTLKTIERITADFPDFDQNRGIERALPTTYNRHPVDLQLLSVEKNDGSNWNYTTYTSNDNYVVRIGDADRYVRGEQTYVITYTQRDVTRSFNSTRSDEFYWDTNGTEWRVPIDRLRVSLAVDGELSSKLNGNVACYQGLAEESGLCTLSQAANTFSAEANNLGSGENVTIAVGFEPGTFTGYKKPLIDYIFMVWFVVTIVMGAVAIGIIIWLIVRWYRWSYRRSEIGTIVPEYLPPGDASVAVVASIVGARQSVFAAQLLDFAIRGYLKLYETKKKTVFKSADYVAEIAKPTADLRAEEKELLSDIYGGHTATVGQRLELSSLRTNHAAQRNMLDNDKKLHELERGQYGLREKNLTQSAWFKTAGWWLLFAGLLLFNPLLIVAAIVAFALGATLWPLTDKGVALYRYAQGMKMYIHVAEEERLQLLQSPEGVQKIGMVDINQPGELLRLYERMLPFAVLFNQEKEWSKRIGDLYETTQSNPGWYVGSTGLHSAGFVSAVSNFSSSVAYSSPTESSSGGSSGGGSSGGGGGGGGGGGW